MRRVGKSRSGHINLLARLPSTDQPMDSRITALIVNPVEQLRELADLFDQGLLTRAEFEHQRRMLFGA